MRLTTGGDRDDDCAAATVAAAVEAGMTVFDTARAYDDGEVLLARVLGGVQAARIVTKGGMARLSGAWVPDGRAKAIRAECEASLGALDGCTIDLYLLHAPDPRTPWRTSVRALAKLVDGGLVRRVGVCNVNRAQLDEALELAPVAAVQVALSLVDDAAVRGGVVARCEQRGVAVIAHSPLGGPRRVRSLLRRPELAAVAAARGVTAGEVALAWVLGASPAVVAIPGARRPEAARSAARAAQLVLGEDERRALSGGPAISPPRRARRAADVVLVMGIPGAGKSRAAESFVAEGYLRLNRDERGGSLRDVAAALEEELAESTRRVVLDNTYLSRAARSHVLDAARRHGAAVRCVYLDTPLVQAQVNLVERLLERFDRLPEPAELRAASRREPGLLAPTSQLRAVRELEPPTEDEGFAAVDHVPFVRAPWGRRRSGVFVAAPALERPGARAAVAGEDDEPRLVFDWLPPGFADALDRAVARLAGEGSGLVEVAVCPHGGGPPRCWCRPPLPGLPLAFARAHDVDPSSSLFVGCSPAHRTLADALGSRYLEV
jgi:aryl-alcohol dehydrogenase-like predicted oxidoreductase